jgi:hypothetical protein
MANGIRTDPRINPARGPIRGEREVNRRKMKAPRPPMTPVLKFRLAQWLRLVEQARGVKGRGRISLGCDRYLRRIKGLPTVQLGGWADVRDDVMAGWLNRSRRTVMRYRAEAIAAGLLEDLATKGLDHKPCLVRPLLPDDGPVFTDTSVTLDTTKLSHQRTLLDFPNKASPPTPSQRQQEEHGAALVAPQVDLGSPSGASPTAPHAIAGDPPPQPDELTDRKCLGDEGGEARPELITIDELWAATDKVGPKSFAAVQFEKLSLSDQVSLTGVIRRDGRWKTGPSWVGHCIRLRLWPRLVGVPTTVEEVGVRVLADTPAGAAWQRFWRENGLQGLAVSGRDGYFIRRLPTEWPPAR